MDDGANDHLRQLIVCDFPLKPHHHQGHRHQGCGDPHHQAADLLRETRMAATDFDQDLQAFRSTIATLTSRQDKDYQKLRAQRAQLVDEDDDPNAPAPPPVVTPASPGVNNP